MARWIKTRISLLVMMIGLLSLACSFQTIQAAQQSPDKKGEAIQNDVEALYVQGMTYFLGDGVPRDYNKAREFFLKAANQGYVPAQFQMGCVIDNDEEAVEWFKKAALQGYAPAQYYLGDRYERGQSVDQDDKKAIELYQKAADQGNARAQLALAGRYEMGEGVPKDIVMATALTMIVVDLDELPNLTKHVVKDLPLLKERVTADEWEEAEALAKSWTPGTRLQRKR